MRRRCLFAALLTLLAIGRARGDEFPYVAYVNSVDVYVRSGPGRDYYPTDRLLKGEKVEVFRHDPGGWYAIRPPRHSFSWVSARQVDPTGDSLAIVNARRAVARVGSSLSDVRDVIQVRLDKGEKVELIEAAAGESPWCKIAPPSGEFRWVFSKFVDREVPVDLADDERTANRAAAADLDRKAERREPGVRLASAQHEADPAAGEAATRAKLTVAEHRDLASETQRQRELDRIELELSTIVAAEITAWSLADLQHRAQNVLGEAQTPVERGKARVVLDKLARFDDIKVRHEAIRRLQADAGQGNPGGTTSRRDDPRFDGVGRLAPVVSQKTGGPQYALVDSSNAVLSFVTPAPGVNLRPYVDKYVGVSGQCGYLTDLQRQHISVQRVTLIDVQRR